MFSSGSLSFRSYIKVFALFLIEFCARWNLISLFYMLISISLSTTSWKGYHFSNACFPLSKIRWLSWLSLRILYLPRHNFYPLLLFPFLHRLSNLQWWIRTNVKTDDLRTVSVSRWDALAGKQACQQASQPEFDCCVESGVLWLESTVEGGKAEEPISKAMAPPHMYCDTSSLSPHTHHTNSSYFLKFRKGFVTLSSED